MARVPDSEWIPLDIAVHAVAHVLLVPTKTAMEKLLEVSRSGTVDWGRLRRPLNWLDVNQSE